MLRNRSLTIGVVKNPKREISEDDDKPLFFDPETINLVRTEVQRTVLILGALYAAKVLLNTASKAAIMSLEAKLLK